MSIKAKIGVIGYGGFGQFICKALASSELFEVVAISDHFKNKSDIPIDISFFKNWKSLLKQSEIEAVLVSTPPSLHAQISLASIRAGKHVMVEKPLATSVSYCEEIIKASKTHNKVVMVDFLQRFNPILEALYGLYKNNLFGNFERYFVENYAQDETLPPSHWFWNREISGGILIEHAVHFIDIVHWFCSSDIKNIHGAADRRNDQQIDRVTAQVHYANGLFASHFHSFTRPNIFERTKMSFVFNTAQFSLDGWIPESGNFSLLGNEEILQQLKKLPNLIISKQEVVPATKVRGKTFNYNRLIEGSFSATKSKQELYAEAIQSIFTDFYQSIRDTNYRPRVTLNDAKKAVCVAEYATNHAFISG